MENLGACYAVLLHDPDLRRRPVTTAEYPARDSNRRRAVPRDLPRDLPQPVPPGVPSARRALRAWLALALTAALCILGLLAAPSAFAQAAPGGSFSVRPTPDEDVERPANPARLRAPTIRSWFGFQGTPGEQIRDSVQVVNTGTVPVDLLLYPVDATTGPTTGMVMQNGDAPRTGVGRWIALAQPQVHLAPGESRDVALTLTVPADARPGEHWGGLIAEDTNVRRGAGQFAVNQVLRTGIALGVTLPGPRVERLALRALSAKVVNNLHQVFVLDLANEGTVMVKPRGALELKDAAGRPAARHELALDNVLAGTAIPYEFFWPHDPLPAGKYHATVTLQTSPDAPPVSLTVPALDVPAPGNRLVHPAPAGSSAALVVVPNAPAGPLGLTGLWATLLPALGGAGVLALTLGAHRLIRRTRSPRVPAPRASGSG